MNDIGTWLQPLIMMPGIGLLIMSTSLRSGQLDAQLQSLSAADGGQEDLLRHLILRSARFRQALISLYASIGLLALGVLVGGLTIGWPTVSLWAVQAILCVAILCIFYAAFVLIREAIHSVEVVQFCSQRILSRNGLSGDHP